MMRKMAPVAVFAAAVLWGGLLSGAAGCEAGGASQEHYEVHYPPGALTVPYAFITEPSGATGITTTEASVVLGGPGVAEQVQWASDRGPSGTTTAAGHWWAEVPLEMGDNVVTVTSRSGTEVGAPDSVTVTRNALTLAGPLAADPWYVRAGEGTEVVFSIQFVYDERLDDVFLTSGPAPLAPRLIRVDGHNQEVETICLLRDSGSDADGDAYGGDLIYSCKAVIEEPLPGSLRVRMHVEATGSAGPEITQSAVRVVPVLRLLTRAEADGFQALGDEAFARYEEARAGGTPQAAAAETVAWLRAQPEIAHAVASEDAYSLSWTVRLPDGGTLPGGMTAGPPGAQAAPRLVVPAAQIQEAMSDSVPNVGVVAETLKHIFEEPVCPWFDPIAVHHAGLPEKPDVAQFRRMGDYGVVAIWAHGAMWQGQTPGEQRSLILTEEVALPRDYGTEPGAPGKYAADVAAWNLIPWRVPGGFRYAITAQFVHRYVSFQRAIVFSAACRGLDDTHSSAGSLHRAFLKKGAAVFLGFRGFASSPWTGSWLQMYFENLLKEMMTPMTAFLVTAGVVGQTDPMVLPGVAPALALMLTRSPQDGDMEINRGCNGAVRVNRTTPTAEWAFWGEYTLQKNTPRSFGVFRREARCGGYERKVTVSELPGGERRANLDVSVAWGESVEVLGDPAPELLRLGENNASVRLQFLHPERGDWVHLEGTYSRQSPYGDAYFGRVSEDVACADGLDEPVLLQDDGTWTLRDGMLTGTHITLSGDTVVTLKFKFKL